MCYGPKGKRAALPPTPTLVELGEGKKLLFPKCLKRAILARYLLPSFGLEIKVKVLPWWLSGKESACQSLVWEEPICFGATKPVSHNY